MCLVLFCPVIGLVGGCGVRAVSRKTNVQFVIHTFSVQVIVGGKTSGYRGILNSSIELFPRPPSKDCYIPNIVSDKPEAQLRRERHSLSLMRGGVLVICGGWDDHVSLDSCVSWVAGNSSWTHLFTMR